MLELMRISILLLRKTGRSMVKLLSKIRWGKSTRAGIDLKFKLENMHSIGADHSALEVAVKVPFIKDFCSILAQTNHQVMQTNGLTWGPESTTCM